MAAAQPLVSSGSASELPKDPQAGIRVSQTVQPLSSFDQAPPLHHRLFKEIPDRAAELKAREPVGCFKVTVLSPLLPGNTELTLLGLGLDEICKEFPFINTREFLHQLKSQGPGNIEAYRSASWWACLNAGVALSVHVKAANGAFKTMSHFAWDFFKNAYATFPELMLQGKEPETAKAMFLMALFCRNSADARTTSLLLSTALRLSQVMGSDKLRADHSQDLNCPESEYTRRTSWSAFVLDAELALCCGFASALDAGDIGIDLPSEECLHDGEDKKCASIFRRRVELALIHSAVRVRLYSRGGLQLPENELLGTTVTLDQTLEDWKQKLPLELRPGTPSEALEPHCVVLHLAFHSLVSMVHWRLSGWGAAMGVKPGEQSLSRSLSRLKVRAAAQHTLRLLQQFPFEQFVQFWYVCLSHTGSAR